MHFKLLFTDEAKNQLESLKNDNSQSKRLKAVMRCLGLIQNNTPGPDSVFWHYGPDQGVITIAAVVPHD
jgi:hypothetical protein